MRIEKKKIFSWKVFVTTKICNSKIFIIRLVRKRCFSGTMHDEVTHLVFSHTSVGHETNYWEFDSIFFSIQIQANIYGQGCSYTIGSSSVVHSTRTSLFKWGEWSTRSKSFCDLIKKDTYSFPLQPLQRRGRVTRSSWILRAS